MFTLACAYCPGIHVDGYSHVVVTQEHIDKQSKYDPCEGKQEGSECTFCAPNDTNCTETMELKTCQKGKCTSIYDATSNSPATSEPATTAPSAPQCLVWCAQLETTWDTKCKWDSCHGCTECSGVCFWHVTRSGRSSTHVHNKSRLREYE